MIRRTHLSAAFVVAIATLIWLPGTVVVMARTCPGGYCPMPNQGWRSPRPAVRPQPAVRPHPAVVRVGYRIGALTSWGSGTIVDRRNGRAYVLTCWHIFRDGQGRAFIRLHDGRNCFANILRLDRRNDLAILEIVDPGIEPIKVADAAPQLGDQLSAAGHGKGRYGVVQGQAHGYVKAEGQAAAESLEMTGAARQGDSGGPILNQRGEVVAVLWGTNNRRIFGTYCPRIRLFLAWLLRRPVMVARPLVPVGDKPSATGTNKPPAESTPSIATRAELAKLQAQIAELEKRIGGLKPVAGSVGPIGPRGLMGPPGPAGTQGDAGDSGASLDVSEIVEQVLSRLPKPSSPGGGKFYYEISPRKQ